MTFTRRYMTLLALVAISAFGQTITTLNLSTQGRNADFANFPFTRPFTQGSTLPSTCQIGQLFFNTAATVGNNVFGCVSTNTWAGMGGGGSSTYVLPPATATALGGVLVPTLSGLNISSTGALSVLYGTAANTAAQGNDSRITGALQSSRNLSDVGSVATALQNLTLTGAYPAMLSAPTSGNAATATRLAATPTACASGQYATGVAASGNANCAQVLIHTDQRSAPRLHPSNCDKQRFRRCDGWLRFGRFFRNLICESGHCRGNGCGRQRHPHHGRTPICRII